MAKIDKSKADSVHALIVKASTQIRNGKDPSRTARELTTELDEAGLTELADVFRDGKP